MKALSALSLASLVALSPWLMACSALSVGGPVKEVKDGPPAAANYTDAMNLELDTRDYSKWLQKDYKSLTLFEYDEMFDYDSSEHFAYKSLMAGEGKIAKPDAVSSRDIKPGYQAEAGTMYGFIQDAYSRGKNWDNPKDMARLQVSYDCWLEQIEEDIQPDHILKCKEMFYDAWDRLKYSPPPPPPPPPEIKTVPVTLVLYFDTGSFAIEPEESAKLQAVVNNPITAHTQVLVEGHADTVDSNDYNDELSQNRAETVKNAIQNIDPSIHNISISAYGETRLAVPTNDKVEEPENRRVIVYFR